MGGGGWAAGRVVGDGAGGGSVDQENAGAECLMLNMGGRTSGRLEDAGAPHLHMLPPGSQIPHWHPTRTGAPPGPPPHPRLSPPHTLSRRLLPECAAGGGGRRALTPFLAPRHASPLLLCAPQAGAATAAAFLETRRYAAYLGATTEFSK